MARTILVAVDLAADEPREVRFAADLARAFSAEVILCHVVDDVPTVLPFALPAGTPVPQLDVVRELAAQHMKRIAEKMGCPGVRSVVEVGAAAERIVECARREGADQIVIGSHKDAAAARLFLGSVADRVAHTASCPVTIVREVRR